LRHAGSPGETATDIGFAHGAAGQREPRFDPGRPLAFMHVPKTSGTSLRTALQECLDVHQPAPGFDATAFGGFRDFATVSPALMRDVYIGDRLPDLGAAFVTGHIARSTLSARRPRVQLLTVLREPRSRLLSHWLFWRGLTDEQLLGWGRWADVIRIARRPLADFLADPAAAGNTDNMAVRMLVWPHPDIPADGFIDRGADRRIVSAALEAVGSFAFADIVENPSLAANLRRWLGRPLEYRQLNETPRLDPALRTSLGRELTQEAFELLDARCRLDRQVWLTLALGSTRPGAMHALAERTILRNVARYSALAM
jgi:hypothetical protein